MQVLSVLPSPLAACDTLTCITGGIAQAFYKEIPDEIITEITQRIPAEFLEIINQLNTHNR